MNVKLPVEPEETFEHGSGGKITGIPSEPGSFTQPWIKLLHILNHVVVHTVGCILLIVVVGGAAWLLNNFALTKGTAWFRGTRFELPAETVMQIADAAIFVLYVLSGFVTTVIALLAEWRER